MWTTNTAKAAIIQKRIRVGLPDENYYDPAASSRRVSDPSIQLMSAAAKGQDRYGGNNARNGGHYTAQLNIY